MSNSVSAAPVFRNARENATGRDPASSGWTDDEFALQLALVQKTTRELARSQQNMHLALILGTLGVVESLCESYLEAHPDGCACRGCERTHVDERDVETIEALARVARITIESDVSGPRLAGTLTGCESFGDQLRLLAELADRSTVLYEAERDADGEVIAPRPDDDQGDDDQDADATPVKIIVAAAAGH